MNSMHNKGISQFKKVVTGGIIALGIFGAIKKHSDSQNRKLYNTIQTIADSKSIQYNMMEPVTQSEKDIFSLFNNQQGYRKNTQINEAIEGYKKNSLPTHDYATPPNQLQKLMQIRLKYFLHPGRQLPTGLEEYNIHVTEQNGSAVCASATTAQERLANNRNKNMWDFFGLTGKNTRNLESLLQQYGRESIIETVDHATIYRDRKDDNTLPTHYDNLLQYAHTIPPLSIITARYADSRKLQDATQANKNATHSMRSLGQITQELDMIDQLGCTENTISGFSTLSKEEKKITLIYHLLYQRAIKPSMLAPETIAKQRIRKLLQKYPDLLQVSRDTDSEDPGQRKAIFHGTMVQHVYPIGSTPTNFVHYLFEMIAYGETGKTNKDGSKFLICDILKPTKKAFKDYSTLSPLYQDIDIIRSEITMDKMISHTIVVSFGQYNKTNDLYIDRNGNKQIDKGDKTIGEIVDSVAYDLYEANAGYSEYEGIDLNTTKDYLRRYLQMLTGDIFPTGTTIPIPKLNIENRATIDRLYPIYKEKMHKLNKASQQKYFHYLEYEYLPTINSHTLDKEITIVYPVCYGDNTLTITKQICLWIEIIQKNLKNPDRYNTFHRDDLTSDQYEDIYTYINNITNNSLNQAQSGKQVIIPLYDIIIELQAYYDTQKKLSTNYLPEIPYAIAGQFADVMKKLDIDESANTIIQQYILRETSGDISFFDITKWRSRGKMIAEKFDMDDHNPIKSFIEYVGLDRGLLGRLIIKSQGATQLRLNYFVEGENHKLPWIIQACTSIVTNNNFDLSNTQKESLQEIIDLSNQLLIEKNKKDKNSEKISQGESQLLHILSDMVNFDSHSLEHPEDDIGTLLSLKLTSYQIQKYRWKYAQKLKIASNEESLSNEQIAFIQQFCLIANHLGEKDADQARKSLIEFYQTEKIKNPDYSLVSVFDENKLIHYIEYVRSLPPHSDHESAIARIIISILGFILYPGLVKRLRINRKDT